MSQLQPGDRVPHAADLAPTTDRSGARASVDPLASVPASELLRLRDLASRTSIDPNETKRIEDAKRTLASLSGSGPHAPHGMEQCRTCGRRRPILVAIPASSAELKPGDPVPHAKDPEFRPRVCPICELPNTFRPC